MPLNLFGNDGWSQMHFHCLNLLPAKVATHFLVVYSAMDGHLTVACSDQRHTRTQEAALVWTCYLKAGHTYLTYFTYPRYLIRCYALNIKASTTASGPLISTSKHFWIILIISTLTQILLNSHKVTCLPKGNWKLCFVTIHLLTNNYQKRMLPNQTSRISIES